MGWSGRAPAPPASEAGQSAEDKEHALSDKLNTAVAVIGIDIGKSSFHVVGRTNVRNSRDTVAVMAT